jgi:NTP pyrophosphatase (non-canonical NTP hydrolase)
MRDYEQLFQAGNSAQREKLKENEHKSGFDDIEINYAIRRISEELQELKDAYLNKGLSEVREEAADIANFAHMIINKIDIELKQ